MAKKLPEVDPLSILPVRYEDRRKAHPVSDFKEGEKILTQGIPKLYEAGDKVTTVTMTGLGGSFFVKFFRISKYYETIFKSKKRWRLLIWGEAKREIGDTWSFYHPELFTADDIGAIMPIYKTPRGISEKRFREHVQETTKRLMETITDEVPLDVLKRHGLHSIKQALRDIHFPVSLPSSDLATLRLVYREVHSIKKRIMDFPRNPAPVMQGDVTQFYKLLPFELTGDQKKAVSEILADMGSGLAMRRLLAGDVGTGKTEVAMAAAYIASRCSYRTVVLSPTTVLAKQTYDKFKSRLGSDMVSLYTGESKQNPALIVIGTHAVLYRKFAGAGLIIQDEQHKFGVDQKHMILGDIHALQMTATPIPRSISLFLYGAVDLSILKKAPFERDVVTPVVPKKDTTRVLGHIRQVTKDGGKALIIYPLVDAEHELYKSVENVREIWESLYPGQVVFVHGRLEDKVELIEMYRSLPDKKILCATSLIETGLDVPEATIMCVAGAERYGLSQLHQLRGRIGRRGGKAWCYLLYKKEEAAERLKPLEKISDGFALSELDADRRGWGRVFGMAQSGNCSLLPQIEIYKTVAQWVNDDVEQMQLPVRAA